MLFPSATTRINVLILWAAGVAQGYGSQRWLTYKEAEKVGGHVRRGERGTVVCYADRFTPKAETEIRAAAGPSWGARKRRFRAASIQGGVAPGSPPFCRAGVASHSTAARASRCARAGSR